MAYSDHFLLQFGGNVGTTSGEIWSCGIRLWSDDYGGLDEMGYLTDVAAPALSAWFGRVDSRIGSYATLVYAKFNHIGPDGHYTEPVTNEHFYPTPIAGGATPTGGMPYQGCLVLSWRSNAATRGPASKGRIYSPAPAVSLTTTSGLFTPAQALSAATSAATLLNTLDVAIAGDVLRPQIMSAIDEAHNQIDSVHVDNRIDIQRKRANSLVAATSVAPISY